MKILSYGAGAIGVYICGSLALAGQQVVFLDRPPVAFEIQNQGLRLSISGQSRTIQHPKVASSLSEALSLGPFDVAIFALKSYDTQSAAEELKQYTNQLPPIVCLQNGVDNEKVLASAIGTDKVIPGTVTSAVGRLAAGEIVLEKLRGVGIANSSPISSRLVIEMNAAGLNARLYKDAASMKWSKMLTNLPANATSAILDMSPAEIFANSELFQFEIRQLREALNVIRAINIRLSDLPGTPVRLFSIAIQSLPLWLSKLVLYRAIGKGRGEKMPSFHIDLNSGRGKSEVTYLNGAIVHYGSFSKIPTPANEFLTDTLMALTLGKIPRNTYSKNPVKFLADFQRIAKTS